LTARRPAGHTIVLLAALAVSPAGRPAVAQVALHATVGARYTSALVHDSIVVPVDVQPAIGPALALAISQRTSSPWTPDANLDVSWSSLQRHESGTTSKFNSVTTIAFTVGVRREIAHGLTARAGFGGIKHLPSEEIGMFRAGTGLWALGTASLYWTPSAAGAAHDIGLSLRYDVHRFSTAALHTDGFTSTQLVHRLSLGIGMRLLGKGATTP
jgi:hypothetical protein